MDKATYFKKIGYKPHPRQWLYHNSTARFKFPVCGRRFGKSVMAGRDLEPDLFKPKQWFWIVGPTYDLAEKEFRVIWDDLIIGQGLGKDKRVKKRYNKKQGDMFIEFPWRTRLECRSADHPDNLVGEALDGVIMSEAAKHKPDTFERFIRPSLADRRGWASMPTTPEGMNWLHKLWQYGQSPDPAFDDYDSWRFPSWENPYVYPGGIDDSEITLMRLTMPSEEFEQEIAADFTAFSGRIYSEFQEDTHVAPVEYNPAWPNYIAFDFGYVNPLAAIEFQVSPDDTIYVWREHYKAQLIMDDHLEILRNREQPPGYKIDLGFGDAADPEAVETISQRFTPCMALPESKSNWREGVDLLKTFLKMRPSLIEIDEYGTPGDDKPGFYIDHSCVNTIREFNNYKAPSATAGKNPKNPRETAHGIDDHALDAIRYALMHIYKLGAQHSLSETIEPLNPNPITIQTFNEITSTDAGIFQMSMGMEF